VELESQVCFRLQQHFDVMFMLSCSCNHVHACNHEWHVHAIMFMLSCSCSCNHVHVIRLCALSLVTNRVDSAFGTACMAPLTNSASLCAHVNNACLHRCMHGLVAHPQRCCNRMYCMYHVFSVYLPPFFPSAVCFFRRCR
jgi:hypothetical protein